jgi:hypothetical protein
MHLHLLATGPHTRQLVGPASGPSTSGPRTITSQQAARMPCSAARPPASFLFTRISAFVHEFLRRDNSQLRISFRSGSVDNSGTTGLHATSGFVETLNRSVDVTLH